MTLQWQGQVVEVSGGEAGTRVADLLVGWRLVGRLWELSDDVTVS